MKIIFAVLGLLFLSLFISYFTPAVKLEAGVETKTRLIALQKAIAHYESDTGRYPANNMGLNALFESFGVKQWQGPYAHRKKAMLDEWLQPFKYEVNNSCIDQKAPYLLYSFGADGIDNCLLGDDIHVKFEN